MDRTTIASPDTLSGSIRAEDPDGLDSIWLAVDAEVTGSDGRFETVYASRYRFGVPAGRPPGTRLTLTLRARDIAGFESARDTAVVVR